jgi:N-acetylmuramoyl-L-alanine amidase
VRVAIPDRAPVTLAARVVDGARYVSSTDLFGALGVEMQWRPSTGELRTRVGNTPIRVRAGDRAITYGARTLRLAHSPRRAGDDLLLPEEFIGPLTAAFLEAEPPVPRALPGGTALRTVIIDPGHGGEDHGAEGPGGLREKNVTLALARRLAARLRGDLGCRVVLTRDGDIAVSLPERTAIANREEADLFISLHANAAPARLAAGYETFVLSATASDAESRRIADAENAAGREGSAALASGFLEQTLQDLIHAESMEESARFASLVQQSLGVALPSENRGVKQAPFWVLAGARMPAVLVEIGFLTNPAEAKRLGNTNVQEEVARAISRAVRGYRVELDRRRGIAAVPGSRPLSEN